MNKLRFFIAFMVAKLGQNFIRLLKRNATYFPGKVALKICPQFLKYINKPEKIVCITGTNGKTTVCNLIEDILEYNNYKHLNNKLGSNIDSGIASSLIEGCNWFGKIKHKLAVFEIDERSSLRIYPYVKPDIFVCTNLFRDSIKRNAHTDFIAGIINKALPEDAKMILNADDLVSCALGKNNVKTYFAIDKLDTDVEETTNIIKDITVCPQCNTKLKYIYGRYHHIGKAYCPNCNFKSPEPDYLVEKIDFENNQISINSKGKHEEYKLIAKSVFNIYNVITAIATLKEMGLNYEQIAKGLENTKIVETRYSEEKIGDLLVVSHLSKGQNPVAASRVFDFMKHEDGTKAVILIIDDTDDAKNSSENLTWLYDADFELLKDEKIKKVIIGGVRAYDYKLRILLAGVNEEKIFVAQNEVDTAAFVTDVEKLFILHDFTQFENMKKIKTELRNKIIKK